MYHVGGSGDGHGPVTNVYQHMFGNVRLVLFEMRETSDTLIAEQYTKNGLPTIIINRCVSGMNGKDWFYVNRDADSSSLLPVSPLTEDENPEYKWCHTWGENAKLDYVIEVDTITIDKVVASGLAPPPDVISIDAQGAELDILQGADKALRQALAVVSEVEFFEIYDGQGLFVDQMLLLSSYGFRIQRVENVQFWHPGPAAGQGFMTVGESVFLLMAITNAQKGKGGFVQMDSLSNERLLRMLGVAFSFSAYGYVYTLACELRRRNPTLFGSMKQMTGYDSIHKMVGFMDDQWKFYEQDPLFWRRGEGKISVEINKVRP